MAPPRNRILWLSHLLPWPPKGGVLQRSYYLMRELAKTHDVDVIAFRQRAHQSSVDERDAAVDEISKFATVIDVFDLPEQRSSRTWLAVRSLLPGPPFTIRWAMCSDFQEAVARAVAERKPDLVHFDTISLVPYLRNIGDTPAVLNHHNIESAMLRRRGRQETNFFKRLYFLQEGRRLARIEKETSGQFLSNLVCADLDAVRFRDVVGKVPIEVVPNGVDLEYFLPASDQHPQDPQSMIFVGGLSWYPNASAIRFFLKQVWPFLDRELQNPEFRLVGRSAPADILDYARRDSRIKALGFVDDIRSLVHRSMVYVCPIFEGGGTKLKMLDAMAMGKAIVAHPVACEGLGITPDREALVAEDPKQFADKIRMLFYDDELRFRLQSSARQHVEKHFSFAEIGASLSEHYRRIISERLHTRSRTPQATGR